MKLLLFDIDGTLIHSSRIGRKIICLAIHEVFATNGLVGEQSFAGKTDLSILTDLLLAQGYSESELNTYLPRVYASMVSQARSVFSSHHLQACPGINALLEKLRTQSDIVLGLQTGNIKGTASLKLSAAHISPDIFTMGAYGSDARDREALIRVARSRAHDLFGFDHRSDEIIVIGDTPADVASAKANDAVSIAVATGTFSLEQLAATGPDFLVKDFSDPEQSMALFLG